MILVSLQITTTSNKYLTIASTEGHTIYYGYKIMSINLQVERKGSYLVIIQMIDFLREQYTEGQSTTGIGFDQRFAWLAHIYV